MINSVILTGYVGKVERIREAGSSKVLNFSLAVNQGRKDDDKPTMWFKCSIWGKSAEYLANKIGKGDKIAVSGELGVEKWEGGSTMTIRVNQYNLAGTSKASQDMF